MSNSKDVICSILNKRGLDLYQAFSFKQFESNCSNNFDPKYRPQLTHTFNATSKESNQSTESNAKESGIETFCLLIGNSKALWQPFLKAYHDPGNPGLAKSSDPLDTYCMQSVLESVSHLNSSKSVEDGSLIYFPNDTVLNLSQCSKTSRSSGRRRISFQRVGETIGFAGVVTSLGFGQLQVRDPQGPWFAYRALYVRQGDGCQSLLDAFLVDQGQNKRSSVKVLETVKENKEEKIMMMNTHFKSVDEMIEERFKLGSLFNPESCNRDWAYDHNQIMYHYTRDKRYLSTNEK